MLETPFAAGASHGQVPPPQQLRGLILDDSSFDRARIKRMGRGLELPLTLDEAGSIEEMSAAVAETSYDLVLIDYRLPVGDGLEALENIAATPHQDRIGKIMITGNAARETAVAAMRAGCHDFLTKDEMDAVALRRSILHAVAMARQVVASPVLDAATQQALVRQGVLEAMQSEEMRSEIARMLQQQTRPDDRLRGSLDGQALDSLLRGLSDADDFHFH